MITGPPKQEEYTAVFDGDRLTAEYVGRERGSLLLGFVTEWGKSLTTTRALTPEEAEYDSRELAKIQTLLNGGRK